MQNTISGNFLSSKGSGGKTAEAGGESTKTIEVQIIPNGGSRPGDARCGTGRKTLAEMLLEHSMRLSVARWEQRRWDAQKKKKKQALSFQKTQTLLVLRTRTAGHQGIDGKGRARPGGLERGTKCSGRSEAILAGDRSGAC